MSKSDKRDVVQATKILLIMTRQGVSQTALGNALGVTHGCINHTIWGIRHNVETQDAIARQLGFKNWEELMNHREVV